jgi:hypothetical protein
VASALVCCLNVWPAMAAEESIQVDVVGTLKTGILAIGAETTGSTITAKGVTWELDFGKNEKLRAEAEKLNGKLARVKGSLERRPGVEIKERWIVTVSELADAAARAPANKQGQGKGVESAPAVVAEGYGEATTIEVQAGQPMVVDVQSPRGIDRCVLKRTGDHWPEQVVLRLHLKGLESLSVAAGETSLAWAVEYAGEAGSPRIRQANVGFPGGAKIVTRPNVAPRIPLEDGYFEIEIPARLLQQDPRELRLQWVDFYR